MHDDVDNDINGIYLTLDVKYSQSIISVVTISFIDFSDRIPDFKMIIPQYTTDFVNNFSEYRDFRFLLIIQSESSYDTGNVMIVIFDISLNATFQPRSVT